MRVEGKYSMIQEEMGTGGSGGGDHGGCGGRPRSLPPAFLTKTYQIVDDPDTNSIVSWGKFGDSFIIWDHINFSAQILPKYFRHNNFASFVYQLNNYGFRKIGVEHQWEYRSPYFQMQKPHLLSKMKRRSEQNLPPRRRRNNLSPEITRDAIIESKQEIEKLKMQQLDMDFHIMAVEQEVKSINNATEKMIVSWAKACRMMITAKRGREETGKQDCDGKRKKKLVDQCADPFVDEMVQELTSPLMSEIQPMKSGHEHEATSKSDTCSNYLEFCKKIVLEVEDDEVCEVKGVNNKFAEISQDFRDLIVGLVRD